MSYNEPFKARLNDIKAALLYSEQLMSLKFSMSEHQKELDKDVAAKTAALDKWHTDESTDPKPVVPDYTATKLALTKTSGIIDSILASMDNTNKLIDQAVAELGA